MPRIACPTCSTISNVATAAAIVACPKCQLTLKVSDNIASDGASHNPPANQWLSPGIVVLAGSLAALILFILVIVVFAESASPTKIKEPNPSLRGYGPQSGNQPAVETRMVTETQRVGEVDFSLVQTMRDSWRKEGWRYKSKSEQAEAMAVIILMVRTDIEDPSDEEATLDYIQRTIGSW